MVLRYYNKPIYYSKIYGGGDLHHPKPPLATPLLSIIHLTTNNYYDKISVQVNEPRLSFTTSYRFIIAEGTP